MGSPGRVPILPPVPTGKGKGSEPSESKSIIAALKPKPGKVKVGKAKKRSSSNVELCLSHTKNSEVPHHLLQSSSPPRGPSPVHRSITHSTSVPLHPVPNRLGRLPKESVHLKTYVAMSDYQSQDDGCLSFQAGDKCVLLRKTKDGWWLVNIGGREGWTPEGFWKEEAWVSHVVCTLHSICSSHDDTVHVAVTVVAKQFFSHNMNYNLVAATTGQKGQDSIRETLRYARSCQGLECR